MMSPTAGSSFDVETTTLCMIHGEQAPVLQEQEEGGDHATNQPTTRTRTTTMQERKERSFVCPHLLKAIELNYKGVCLLQSDGGNEEQAIAVFKQSLACIKTYLAATKKASSSSSSSSPSSSSSLPFYHQHPTPPSGCCSRNSLHNVDDEEQQATKGNPSSSQTVAQQPFHVAPCSPSLPETGSTDQHMIDHRQRIVSVEVYDPNSLDKNLFVFTKAFAYLPWSVVGNHQEPGNHAPQQCPFSIVDSELLSAMIIYNIGLGLHIKAFQINCSSLQQRSQSLYEMTMGLLHRILKGNYYNDHNDNGLHYLMNFKDDDLPSGHISVITSMLIACSNNVGHLLHYLQDDYKRSCQILQNLQFLLKLLWTNMVHDACWEGPPPSSSASSSPTTMSHHTLLEHRDIQGFTWNLVFMYPAPYAPAA